MKSTTGRLSIGVALIIAIGFVSPVFAEWNKGLEAYKAKDWATAAKGDPKPKMVAATINSVLINTNFPHLYVGYLINAILRASEITPAFR